MKRWMRMVGAALTVSLGVLPVMAQKAAVTAPHLLTVLEANAKPGNAVYEAGSRGPQTAAGPWEHTFVLRNTTGKALTLDHLQASCACTTATVVGGTSADGPTVLAPNGTLSVRVSVDPQRLSPGLLHKSVWVFVQGQAAPAATLEMTGALLPSVSFSPSSLSFGRLEKGTELTLLLRATTQPEQLEPGTVLRLVSPDPDIQVSEVAPDAPPVCAGGSPGGLGLDGENEDDGAGTASRESGVFAPVGKSEARPGADDVDWRFCGELSEADGAGNEAVRARLVGVQSGRKGANNARRADAGQGIIGRASASAASWFCFGRHFGAIGAAFAG